MLGGRCSLCCCIPHGAFRLAPAVSVTLRYEYVDTLTTFPDNQTVGLASVIDGTYTLTPSPAGPGIYDTTVSVEGVPYQLSASFFGDPASQMGFRVFRNNTPSWRRLIQGQGGWPFPSTSQSGEIGFAEAGCLGGVDGSAVALSNPVWRDSHGLDFTKKIPVIENTGSAGSPFTLRFERDGVVAVEGSFSPSRGVVGGSRIAAQTAQAYGTLLNACGDLSTIGFLPESPPPAVLVSVQGAIFEPAYTSGGQFDNEPARTWMFKESLRVTSLEAVFPDFSQSVLMTVDPPLWRHDVPSGPNQSVFRIGDGGQFPDTIFDWINVDSYCEQL
jgi:hypothetical protein